MALVFISYCRESQEKIRSLAQDLEAMGHQVWLDQALTGGQAWWNLILNEIARCDVFAFALDPQSLDSPPCKLEYTYAAKLGKSILPVLVTDGVNLDHLPGALAEIQFVDYRREDREAFRSLVKAINSLPPSQPLPDPLPPPPLAPVSYLAGLRERVEGPPGLSFEDQTGTVLRLKHALRESKQTDDVRSLLRQFRFREDLYARVADEIDSLLAEASVPPAAPKVPDIPPPKARPAEKVSDPVVVPETKLPDPVESAVKKDRLSAPSGSLSEVLSFNQVWISVLAGLVISVALDSLMSVRWQYEFQSMIYGTAEPFPTYPSKFFLRPSWSLPAAVVLCITVVWRKMAFRPLFKKLLLITLSVLFGSLISLSRMTGLWELGFSGAFLSLFFVIIVLWHGTPAKPVPLKKALLALAVSLAVLVVFSLDTLGYYGIILLVEKLLGMGFVGCFLFMLFRKLRSDP